MSGRFEVINTTPSLINLPNGSEVFNGIPLQTRSYGEVQAIEVPRIPHVFRVRRVQFNRTAPIYDDVVVVLGHAIFVLSNGLYHWRFSDGQSVSKVIEGLHVALEANVDLIIACSGSYADVNISSHTTPFLAMPSTELVRGLPKGVTYFYGEDIKVSSFFLDTDQISVNIRCNSERMRNPEVLERKRSKYEYREG